MSDTLRLFVAIDLPAEVKHLMSSFQHHLQRRAGPAARAAKWVDPEGTHLTLVFLGNVETRRVDGIADALAAVATDTASFRLQTAAAGGFPNVNRPRTLWLGIEGHRPSLERLQERVAVALEPLGFPREDRRFAPHLTLARVRQHASTSDVRQLGQAIQSTPAPPPAEIPVGEVVLFRSDLERSGARYARLSTVPLSG